MRKVAVRIRLSTQKIGIDTFRTENTMTTTNSLTKELLEQGGVEVPTSDQEGRVSLLEAWLGLPEAEQLWETEGMESMAPFDERFYGCLEKLLIHVWKPRDDSNSLNFLSNNVLLELDCDPSKASLYSAMESVRVTRILRFWMDLNVMGSRSTMNDDDDGDKDSLTQILLSYASQLENSTTGQPQACMLIDALYNHLEQLPFLQSQIYAYIQTLRRGYKKSIAPATAHSRLQLFQEAERVNSQLNQQWQEHIDRLEYIMGEFYAKGSTAIRRQTRTHLGGLWSQFVVRSGNVGGISMENTTSSGIQISLRLLHRILLGTGDKLHKSHEHLLYNHLIPLHQPSSMVLWRDQTSLLELYHEPLVQCIAVLLQKNPEWIPTTIKALMEPDVWSKGGNTPKMVLLLHEIDMYLALLPDPESNPHVMGEVYPTLLRTVGTCMASDHSQLAERALSYVKTKNFQALVQENFELSLSILLPFLVKSEPSWNPTVRKMTYSVLKSFQDIDERRFLEASNRCFPTNTPPVLAETAPKPPSGTTSLLEGVPDAQPQQPKDFSLKAAMGDWKAPKPPSRLGVPRAPNAPRNGRGSMGNAGTPPLGVTGVAPWSVNQTPTNSAMSRNSARNPPLGVTGVAPWAKGNTQPPRSKRPAIVALSEHSEDTTEKDHSGETSRVLQFMAQIKPAEQVGGTSAWSKVQMAETPTLLPNLKFHDLVFGHDLGSGAFGSVRYARLIDRTRTRSHWPEFAVKIISTERIKEMGYEASVQRELAVLRIVSHPGIARLVSAFRFGEGVYLVLEYASRGDLHSLIRKNGSLDHASTRFVMGEIVAALSSIHDLGLVYGDLKPENIVISETGHVKLTDFGGCRPVSDKAKEMIQSSARNLLRDLRDGDWKQRKEVAHEQRGIDNSEEMDEDFTDYCDSDIPHDDRIEGTTAYLPPEVVMGGVPTLAADAWALGCVIYQCLSGRPPILEADDASTRNRIVTFDTEAPQTVENQLFGGTHGSSIQSEARDLILKLLSRVSTERPGMNAIAQHAFFTTNGSNVFTLYQEPAHPLDVGDVTPVADAQWSRRQFSSIWAPQPQAYDISGIQVRKRSNLSVSTDPIMEGDECTFLFSMQSHPRGLSNLPEEKFPLPLSTKSVKA